jgi:hypothetical protein
MALSFHDRSRAAADIARRVTAELSLSVTKRSGTRRTRRHGGIGDLPPEAGLLMRVCC